MSTTINLKRKNIDLPADTLKKLSFMAVSQGKSLKAYIEQVLIAKASTINIKVNENPSPSNDEWFNDSKNIEEIQESIAINGYFSGKWQTRRYQKSFRCMNYKILLTKKAEEHLKEWKKSGQKKTLLKIISLFEELQLHPTSGTGQVEQLKGNLSGYWSRRIDKGSRMVYFIEEDKVVVTIISLKGHY